ncbi:MAG: hydantoinase B/oxoprolinase family protein [Desulfobacterales bacterium]|nr:hydantoinase B/oxoprolinase family protein [Desulfobacterales bacterium]
MIRKAMSYQPWDQGEFQLRSDPIIYEVIRHRLWQINREQGQTLMNTSGSPVVTEANDFNVVISNKTGDVISIGPYVFIHFYGVANAIKNTLKFYGDAGIEEGDMYVSNDPWVTGPHQVDYTLVAPVHFHGKLAAFVGATLHLIDAGSAWPGAWCIGARTAFEEQPRFRYLRLVEKGRFRPEVMETIRCNSRLPDRNELDLKAAVAAAQVAKERMFGLFDRYGPDLIENVMDDMINVSDFSLRKRLRTIPDGQWEGEAFVEHDGFEDKLYTYRAVLKKEGDKLSFDFSQSSDQAPSFINGTSGVLCAGVLCTVGVCLCNDIAWNAGIFKCVEILSRLGTVVDAKFPAPVSSNTGFWASIEASLPAVSKMLSCSEEFNKNVMGQWMASWLLVTFAGAKKSGEPFVFHEMSSKYGGGGARFDADGVDHGGNMTSPVPAIPNVESFELEYPVLYIFRKRAMDSAGAGKFRGGVSGAFALTPHEIDSMAMVLSTYDTDQSGATSFNGGFPGAGNQAVVWRNSDIWEQYARGDIPADIHEFSGRQEIQPAKVNGRLNNGDIFFSVCSGGGSLGDPLERDPVATAADVREGVTSVERARNLYGVIVDPSTLEPCLEDTRKLRHKIRSQRLKRGRFITGEAFTGPPGKGKEKQQRLGGNLYIEKGVVYCARCDGAISPATENPKSRCLYLTEPLGIASPWISLRSGGDSVRFHFKEYICPHCGTLVFVDQRPKDADTWHDFKLASE